MWKWVSKNCSTNEYINEFVVIFKFNDLKKISHSCSNLFTSTPKKQSKKFETEPTKLLQSKDPWNQSEFDILTKDSIGILRSEH